MGTAPGAAFELNGNISYQGFSAQHSAHRDTPRRVLAKLLILLYANHPTAIQFLRRPQDGSTFAHAPALQGGPEFKEVGNRGESSLLDQTSAAYIEGKPLHELRAPLPPGLAALTMVSFKLPPLFPDNLLWFLHRVKHFRRPSEADEATRSTLDSLPRFQRHVWPASAMS